MKICRPTILTTKTTTTKTRTICRRCNQMVILSKTRQSDNLLIFLPRTILAKMRFRLSRLR
jgi:hypothetical protein